MKIKNIILVIFILSFLSACSKEKETMLPLTDDSPAGSVIVDSVSVGQDTNSVLDDCSLERNVLVRGYISELHEDYMIVISPNKKTNKIKFTKETVFLKMYLNEEEVLVSQKNISKEDMEEGKGVAVDGVWEESCEDNEYEALIVKQILLLET